MFLKYVELRVNYCLQGLSAIVKITDLIACPALSTDLTFGNCME